MADREAAELRIQSRLAGSPIFVKAVRDLRRMASSCTPDEVAVKPGHLSERDFLSQRAVMAISQQDFVSADIQDIREHLQEARGVKHPEEGWGAAESAPHSLRAAVRQLGAWQGALQSKRRKALNRVLVIAASLEPLSESLRAEFAPPHIADMKAPHAHSAWLACISEAFGGDSRIAADATLGVAVVGRVPASGAFSPILPEDRHVPTKRWEELDHSAWNKELALSTARRAAELRSLPADDPAREDASSVWSATMKEREKGLVHGPFSAADLDARFGGGLWRAIRRFGVWQKGKCRACDNCAESGHNDATILEEALVCDTADFPARAAALLVAELGTEGLLSEGLRGGTEDVEAAYRRILSASPGATVFCLPDPETGEPCFFSLPGLNFGLASAPVSFSRFPRLAMQLCRRVLAVVLTHFYDDFCVIDPAAGGSSAQDALRAVMESIGLPLSSEKHVPMSERVSFLGVECDLSDFQKEGEVRLGISKERGESIANEAEAFLAADALPPGSAAKFAGRLAFATSWAAGRLGRPVLRPIFDQAHRDGERQISPLLPSVRGALAFLIEVLRRPGGLPPRIFRFARAAKPTVRIWTDAMYVPGSPAGIAFYVEFPAEPGRGSPRTERFHGSVFVGAEVTDRFVPEKTQYIGQLELLAALTPYTSLRERLKGRRVVHWIDNTSAIAALCKGYSAAPDSARILQAFATLRMDIDCPIWFQWVPSKANIADLPSRREFGLLEELGSSKVPLILPLFASWDAPFARWSSSPGGSNRERGSIAVGNLAARAREAVDPAAWEVRVDRTRPGQPRSPLGNPFPMKDTQDRAAVIEAFEKLLLSGASVEIVARSFTPPLVFDRSYASREADRARSSELGRLAAFSAAGGSLRLMCWCAPRQCHAASIARAVASLAEKEKGLARGI